MVQVLSSLGAVAANIRQYVVTPLNAFGLGGFVFDVEGETTINLSTEITDHYVEDATTIQDHIVIKPKRITLKNYVGELADIQRGNEATTVQRVTQKLTTISSYLPALTQAATQALQNKDSNILSNVLLNPFTSLTINQVSDYWSYVKNLTGTQTKQQRAYMYLKALMEQKVLMSVQTPFEFLPRMAIESIVARQNEGEKYVSDFTITLKQIRTAALLESPRMVYQVTQEGVISDDNMQGRVFEQMQGVTNQGAIQGLPIPSTDPPPLPPVFRDVIQ
jgi:hypothetical protein